MKNLYIRFVEWLMRGLGEELPTLYRLKMEHKLALDLQEKRLLEWANQRHQVQQDEIELLVTDRRLKGERITILNEEIALLKQAKEKASAQAAKDTAEILRLKAEINSQNNQLNRSIKIPQTEFVEKAKELVKEQEKICVAGTSGEYKRHQVYARLIKAFPAAYRKELSKAIEFAVEKVK